MWDLILSDKDKNWLQVQYPDLKIFKNNAGIVEIAGNFRFSMVFLGEGKPYIINPQKDYPEGIRIDGEYKIKIELQKSKFSNLPQVYECGNRIKKVAQNKGLGLEDLHINPNGAACLCIQEEELENLPNGFNLEDFFNNLLVPFFYAQSFFEKRGIWPWGQYSHGVWGLIEWYSKQDNSTQKTTKSFIEKRLKKYVSEWQLLSKLLDPKYKVKGHHQCICGKNEKFRKCHKDVLHGIWKLKQDIAKFGIKMR